MRVQQSQRYKQRIIRSLFKGIMANNTLEEEAR